MSHSSKNGYSVNGYPKKHVERYQDPVREFVNRLESGGWEPRPTSSGMWESFCPAHSTRGESRNRSLQVNTGDDGRCLLHCFGNDCRLEDIAGSVGMEVTQLFPKKDEPMNYGSNGDHRRRFGSARDATSHLVSEFGEPEVYRYTPDFWILRFSTKDGKDIRPVSRTDSGWAICDPSKTGLPLYNLKALRDLPDGSTVWVVEGEKCVEIFRRLGIPATTSCHGSKAASKTDWSPLARFKVVLNPDNDSPGEDYARAVAGILGALPKPPEVRFVRFANLPPSGDIEQHLENCGGFDDAAIREDLERMVAESSPETLPGKPEIEVITLRDIKNLIGEGGRFLSKNFMVKHHLNALGAQEKVGKTHLALDICRRIYFAQEWPNGDPASFAAGTRTLWIPGDRHHDEVMERGEAMGVPPEAFILNGQKNDEFGGINLDDPENLSRLDQLCQENRPALIVIDTLNGTTARKMNDAVEVAAFFNPIIDIAKRNETTILALTHLNKSGDFLNLRIKGVARALWTLTAPDPTTPDRRRLEIKGNFPMPMPMGVTLHELGAEYDWDPPAPAPEEGDRRHGGGGRPQGSRVVAKDWVLSKLQEENHRRATLLQEEAAETGICVKPTFWRAVEDLEKEGKIIRDGKPFILHLRQSAKSDDDIYWDTPLSQ